MKRLFLTAVLALTCSPAFAQATGSLATPTGHQVNAGISSYTYREPSAQSISIHSKMKFAGEYTGTLSLNRQRHFFAQANFSK